MATLNKGSAMDKILTIGLIIMAAITLLAVTTGNNLYVG